jgi:microcystin-dependent protein
MSVPLVVNGVTFNYPQEFDLHWGPVLTAWSTAVTNALKPLTGGILTLPLFPNSGVLFANATNTGFISLTVNGSNQLTFNGVPIGTPASLASSHIFVGNVSNAPTDVAMTGDVSITNTGLTSVNSVQNLAITNAMVNATAAIALTKLASTTAYDWYAANGAGVLTPLAVTPSRAVATDSNGLPVASSTTATELGYLSGVTSSIQTQINAVSSVPSGVMLDFAGTVAPTGYLLCDGSSYLVATYPALFAAIGTTWGGGGPTFNVPNMSRRIAMGSGGAGTATIGNSVGNIGGEETHTLTSAEIPNTAVSVAVSDPTHNHELLTTTINGVKNAVPLTDSNARGTAATASNPDGTIYVNSNNAGTPWVQAHSTGITASGTVGGSNGAHNNIQPSVIVLKIIKI